ncbi:MAG: MarR family transcriptional regulator [Ruminococcaceae bacterium]|nr:MarR family transcriptional regulator [Oscillospiraceae bacterium]
MRDKLSSPVRLITSISRKLKRGADENLIREKITVEQVMVMRMIHENGGSVGQKDIEKAFEVRRSTVTSAMQTLEKKGFIVRSPHPDDSRAKIVTLTASGIEKNRKLINFIEERDEKLLVGLTSEEKDTLTSLLLKISENID